MMMLMMITMMMMMMMMMMIVRGIMVIARARVPHRVRTAQQHLHNDISIKRGRSDADDDAADADDVLLTTDP
jgi:hypothetical protein